MKKILTIALLLIAINAQGQGLPVAANATLASLFPDENLRRVVAEVLGPNAGLTGQRLSDELARVEKISAFGDSYSNQRRVENANGIEYLTGLTELWLWLDCLSSININTLVNLEVLQIAGNELISIDLSNNVNLALINIASNRLTTIDVSNNTNLRWLVIANNPLITLKLGNNINLEGLDISHTYITNLDVSSLINLKYLEIKGTELVVQNIVGLRDSTILNGMYEQ